MDFDVKTDPNIDQVLTQLRTAQAQPQFPAQVNTAGLLIQKSLSAPLMLVSLNSPKGTYDNTFLANYAYINLVDELTRVPGIARVQVFGAGQYAMRIWVKPDQLAKLGVTVPQIIQALQTQNNVNPAGQVGGEPIAAGPAVHLYGARAGAADHARRVRRDHSARESGRIESAAERRRAHGNGRAELRLDRPLQRKAGGGAGDVISFPARMRWMPPKAPARARSTS